MRKALALFLLIAMVLTALCACKRSPEENKTTAETETVEKKDEEVVPTKTTKTITNGITDKDKGWAFWMSF